MTRARALALGLAVAMLAGVVAPGAAVGGTPERGVGVEVTVWREIDDDGDLYVGAREADRLWRRDATALDLSATSASGRFHRSGVVAMTVPLAGFGEVVVEAVVWRSVADPSRLHLSVRPEGGRWRTVNEPLAMRVYEPDEWQRYERADAVMVEFAFPGRLPLASVTGPLAVFTAESEIWTDAGGWGRAREMYALDTATGRYWRAFSGRVGVATAGERLIIWDGERVRRVWLAGGDQVLYEGEDIRQVEVSPDGAKVAVMEGGGTLTVLDATTGETLLRVAGQAELTALLPDASARTFSLLGWNITSDRLAVAAVEKGHLYSMAVEGSHTGILALDGALRVLPLNARNLSPDFRYAIQPRADYWFAWDGFDVIETASGRVVRTVTVAKDAFVLTQGWWPDANRYSVRGWWPDANRYAWFEMGRVQPGACGYDLRGQQPRAEGAVTAASPCGVAWGEAADEARGWEIGSETSAVGPRVLDIASGAIGQPSRDEWYGLRTERTRLTTRGSCWSNADGQACGLYHEGRPVWNGAVEAIGVIELAEPLALFDARLLDSPQPSANPPAPPDAAEIIGPLFAWSVAGGYERAMDTAGNERFQPIRRVMVRDEGTGRSWRVLDYPLAGGIWLARGGFVVQSGNALRFVTPAGETRTLLVDDRIGHPDSRFSIHVSPGGGKVIASLRKWDEFDVTLVVLALPSGEELLRVESREPRFEEVLRERRDYWNESFHTALPPAAFVPLAWNVDETAFSVALGYRDEPWGVFRLNGEFTPLPPDAEFGAPVESPAPERASVQCPDDSDHIQWCSVLLDGEVVGEGRWAEAIGFVALD